MPQHKTPLIAIAAIVSPLLLATTTASAATFEWDVDADGDWNSAANWDPDTDFPDASGDDAVVLFDITADRTITVPDVTGDSGVDFTINSLEIGDASHKYTIGGPGKLDIGESSFNTGFLQIRNGGVVQLDADIVTRSFPSVTGNGTVIVNGTIAAGGKSIGFGNGITARINSPIQNIGSTRTVKANTALEIGMDGTIAPGGGGVEVGQTATFRTFGGDRTVEDDFIIGMQGNDAQSQFVGDNGNLTINGDVSFNTPGGSFGVDFRVKSGHLNFAGGVEWSEANRDVAYIVDGTLELSGSGNFSGSKDVDINGGGTLLLNNTDGSATGTNNALILASGITLAGDGQTDSAVNLNGGTVAPGNSIGELTVGNLTSEDGTFEFDLAADGSSDTLNVGDLDLNGTDTLNLLGDVGDPVLAYTLIKYTGTLTGEFDTVTFNGEAPPDNFVLDLGSRSNDTITLTVIPEPAAAGLVLFGGLALLGRRCRWTA